VPLHDTTSRDIPIKRCSKCGEEKPATVEYFRRAKKGKYALAAQCKICDVERRAPAKARAAEKSRAWHAANKERKAEHDRAYRAANKERLAKRDHARYEANKERHAEYQHAWYESNKDITIKRARAWGKANPDQIRVRSIRRRAREVNAEGTHTAADIKAQYDRQKGKCYWCGCKVGNSFQVDHIVPLSRGGSNWPDNLVIACRSCNLSKHNKLPHEWVQGGRLL
jgi:5-methylcytosine-specific restriction endonuclease McrA